MTTTNHWSCPPTARAGPFVFTLPLIASQFRAYRQAGLHLKTGTLLGAYLSPGNRLLLTQALSWPRSDFPHRPFAVGIAHQEAVLDTLNRDDGTLLTQRRERPQITQVGHWMVMPSGPFEGDDLPFTSTGEVCAREMAVLEHAVRERWLKAPQFILAICEEGGQTRVRAYVLEPGQPIYPVYFFDDELNPVAATLPQQQVSEGMALDPSHQDSE